MKFHSRIASALAVCAAALLSASCVQNELEQPGMPEYITGITVSGQDVDFSEFETKVSYTDRLAFSWNVGDRLGIFPIGGKQQEFPLSDIGNGTSANFDGGAWALRSNYEYAGYYPFADDKSNTKDLMLPVDYTHQKQISNMSTANLGEYSYMISEATKPDAAGSVNLQMKQLGGVVRAEATVPAGIDFCRATLVDNSAEMIVGGKVDLGRKHEGSSAFVPEIEEPVYGDRVAIDFEDVVVEESADGSNNLIFYFWMAPQSLSGHELSLVLEERDGAIYTLNTTCGTDIIAAKGKRIDFGSVEEPEDVDYLCFTAVEDASVYLLVEDNRYWDGPEVEYSLDGRSWSSLRNYSVFLNAGDSVYLRGENDTFSLDDERYAHFGFWGKVEASGNVMTLLDKRGLRNSVGEYCFYMLFSDCTGLVSAPELPAETLAPRCYFGMFVNCTSLIDAPTLPATELADRCYSNLFNGCTSLTSAPQLPAETLAPYCYYNMFSKCTSLSSAPELPAETMAPYCYASMFYGCSSLSTAPELPAETMDSCCYTYMFQNCTSLTSAPQLPAETLANTCYAGMFLGCTNLTDAPELPAKTLAIFCYYTMFQGCTSLTSAPELPAETLAPFCYHYMFSKCTSLSSAPDLPAETLANSCYTCMFSGCSSLTSAPALPAETLADSCYSLMFYGCSSLTEAPVLPAQSLAGGCYNRMFFDCTSLNQVNASFVNVPDAGCLEGWLNGTSETGTFIKNPNATWTREEAQIPEGWAIITGTGASGEDLDPDW